MKFRRFGLPNRHAGRRLFGRKAGRFPKPGKQSGGFEGRSVRLRPDRAVGVGLNEADLLISADAELLPFNHGPVRLLADDELSRVVAIELDVARDDALAGRAVRRQGGSTIKQPECRGDGGEEAVFCSVAS